MERKGQVLILLVEQALSFQDYKAASMHCQELMAAGEVNKWGLHGVMLVKIRVLPFGFTVMCGTSEWSFSFKNKLQFVWNQLTSLWNGEAYRKYCM